MVALLGLQALWWVPDEAEERGVAEWTGWGMIGLGGSTDPVLDADEAVRTWGEAREAFCKALGEAEWLEAIGRLGRLLPIPEGVVVGCAVVLLVLSLGAQLGRAGERWWLRDVMVEWAVHFAMVAALGATYVGVFGVVLALRRSEGRRATVLALVIVARVACPLLGPLVCLDGGWAWVKAGWAASLGFLF